MAGAGDHPKLLKAVREVLFREWDPIGVNDEPLCEGEYDSYAPAICRMLEANVKAVKLAAHLGRLRTGSMGMSDGEGRREHDRRIADRLVGLAVGKQHGVETHA